MKPKRPEGVVMFGGSPDGDWLVVELAGGAVRYSFQADGRSRQIRTMNLPLSAAGLSDTWHDVTIQRLPPNGHLLRVDNASTTNMTISPAGSRPVRSPQLPLPPPSDSHVVSGTPLAVTDASGAAYRLNRMTSSTISISKSRTRAARSATSAGQLGDVSRPMTSTVSADDLFIGGIPLALLTSLPGGVIQSRIGFQGCLASINLHGDGRSLRSRGYHVPEEHHRDVIEGCEGE